MTYTFRPARLRRAQKWTLSQDSISGPGGTIALRDVRETALIQLRTGGLKVVRFDVMTGQEAARLQVTMSARGGPSPDADREQFFALISELASRMAEIRPDLTYRMEEAGPRRTRLFLVGLLALLIGLVLTGLAFLQYFDQWPVLLTLLPFLAATKIFGGVLVWRFWPLRRLEAFPIVTLPFLIWTMGGPRPVGIAADHPPPMS